MEAALELEITVNQSLLDLHKVVAHKTLFQCRQNQLIQTKSHSFEFGKKWQFTPSGFFVMYPERHRSNHVCPCVTICWQFQRSGPISPWLQHARSDRSKRILSAPTLLVMVLLMVLLMAACHSHSLLMVLLMVLLRNSLLKVLLLVLLRQWRCTNYQASIHHQTIHTPLAHQTRGRTILPWSSRMVFDTHQGSHNGPHSQHNSCHTSNARGSSLNHMRSGCRCMSHAKCPHGRRHLHQKPSLIHSGELDSLPRFCPGTSCPSSNRWSQSPCHTSPQFHSYSSVHTLRSNHHTRSPLGCSSCRTSNPSNHNQRRN